MADYHRVEIAQPELKALADAVKDRPVDRYAHDVVDRDIEGQQRYMAAYRQAAAQDPIQITWDANEPEFHAKTKIFKVLAEGFETEMGEAEGRDAVNRTRRRQGEEMGRKMADEVRAAGKPLSLGNFFEVFWSYFQWSPKFDIERYYDENDNLVKFVLRLNCPIGDFLREHAPDVEFSSNYCDLDEYIAHAYNPNIRYSRRHWVPGGDLYSELIWELDSDGIIE
jgi:hypothetical protein